MIRRFPLKKLKQKIYNLKMAVGHTMVCEVEIWTNRKKEENFRPCMMVHRVIKQGSR